MTSTASLCLSTDLGRGRYRTGGRRQGREGAMERDFFHMKRGDNCGKRREFGEGCLIFSGGSAPQYILGGGKKKKKKRKATLLGGEDQHRKKGRTPMPSPLWCSHCSGERGGGSFFAGRFPWEKLQRGVIRKKRPVGTKKVAWD